MDDVSRPQRTVPVARPSSPVLQPAVSTPIEQPQAPTESIPTAPVVPVTPAPAPLGTQPAFQAETPQFGAAPVTPDLSDVSVQPKPVASPAAVDHSASTRVPSHPAPTSESDRNENRATNNQKSNTRHHRKGGRAFVIILAVLFAVALIGGGVFAYMLHQKESTSDSRSATTTQIPQTPTTQDEIDSTTKAIDTALKDLNDTTDFAETSLSNTTLGL